jgi:transglutaminase-like putative cysteine protease
MVFHEYTSDGWDNTDIDTILLDEYEQALVVPDFEYRREVTQTITLKQNMRIDGAIAAAGQPVRAGVPIRALVSSLGQEEDSTLSRANSVPLTAPGDASVFYSQIPLYAGDTYQVVSSLTQADQESLRQAGTDYPAWVVPRYLQLPDSVPTRIRILAEQITEGLEIPYDKAEAIERYLREIPYTEKIDEPAPGKDGVDYFLFDIRKGYCDYYASSMVVMLRATGVPARYVRGYSQAERVAGVYEVREWDGHAWPEVFFPGYGWVEFEPTGGEPVLVRPVSRNEGASGLGPNRDRPVPDDGRSEMLDLTEPGVLGSAVDPPVAGSGSQTDPRWWWLALDLALAVPVVIALSMARRRRQIAGLSAAERVYYDLVGWVRRLLHIGPLSHQTPYEYAGVLGQVIPAGREAVTRIAGFYVEERFGGKVVSGQEAEGAWEEAKPALRRRWLQYLSERAKATLRKLLGRPLPDPEWQRMVGSSEE